MKAGSEYERALIQTVGILRARWDTVGRWGSATITIYDQKAHASQKLKLRCTYKESHHDWITKLRNKVIEWRNKLIMMGSNNDSYYRNRNGWWGYACFDVHEFWRTHPLLTPYFARKLTMSDFLCLQWVFRKKKCWSFSMSTWYSSPRSESSCNNESNSLKYFGSFSKFIQDRRGQCA